MKNKRSMIIIIAMVLLLAVVLGMGGATFAKYVTSSELHTEQATVAKWGFTATANASGLFGEQYNSSGVINADGKAIVSADAANDGDQNVVAPGSKGTLTFSISGTAEVASQVTVTVTADDISLTKADPAVTYNPLKWTLKKGSSVVNNGTKDLENVTIAEIKAYLDHNVYVPANTPYTRAGDYTLEYVWPFETNSTNNGYDTLLGQAIHAGQSTISGYTADTSANVGIIITIQQVPMDITTETVVAP